MTQAPQAPPGPSAAPPPAQIGLHGVQEHLLEVVRKLYLGVHYICGAGVEGDVAEFGTMTGLTASLLARALNDLDHYGPDRRQLHLFDSFEGLPPIDSEVDQQSLHVQAGVWKPGACRGVSKEQLHAMCAQTLPADRVHVYDGWFKSTVSELPADRQLALLHLDCDLYESTMDALGGCLERGIVAEGAAIFFDDYNCNRASPRSGERKAWRDCIERFGIEFSDAGEYGWCGHKFHIHNYQGMPMPASA